MRARSPDSKTRPEEDTWRKNGSPEWWKWGERFPGSLRICIKVSEGVGV